MKTVFSCTKFRATETSLAYYWLENVCMYEKTCCRGCFHFPQVIFLFVSFTYNTCPVISKMRWHVVCLRLFTLIFLVHNFRDENGELRVGVRRAMRKPGNSSASVISGQSMRLGVLASASHAITSGAMFTLYYWPRYAILLHVFCFNHKRIWTVANAKTKVSLLIPVLISTVQEKPWISDSVWSIYGIR